MIVILDIDSGNKKFFKLILENVDKTLMTNYNFYSSKIFLSFWAMFDKNTGVLLHHIDVKGFSIPK